MAEVEKFPFPNEKKEFSLPDDIKQLKCIKGGTSQTKESNTESTYVIQIFIVY